MDIIDYVLIGILVLIALTFIISISGSSGRREGNSTDMVNNLVFILVKIFPVLLILILLFVLFIL